MNRCNAKYRPKFKAGDFSASNCLRGRAIGPCVSHGTRFPKEGRPWRLHCPNFARGRHFRQRFGVKAEKGGAGCALKRVESKEIQKGFCYYF